MICSIKKKIISMNILYRFILSGKRASYSYLSVRLLVKVPSPDYIVYFILRLFSVFYNLKTCIGMTKKQNLIKMFVFFLLFHKWITSHGYNLMMGPFSFAREPIRWLCTHSSSWIVDRLLRKGKQRWSNIHLF